MTGYEIKQAGLAMGLAKIMKKHGEMKPIKRLVEDISTAACKGIESESLWSDLPQKRPTQIMSHTIQNT